MTRPRQYVIRGASITARAATAALAIAVVFALTVGFTPSAQAQTFQVLHTFTGQWDGGSPYAGLTMDRAGNLYGTTYFGGTGCGPSQCGTVFRLTRSGSGWLLSTLYTFGGGNGSDGQNPYARVVFGPDGSLYGTTTGGGQYGLGVVFNLKPPATPCKTALCPWNETVLYSFSFDNGGFGLYPVGDLIFDAAGNLYGVTEIGGQGDCYGGCGDAYKLTPSGGTWTLSAVYGFQGGTDGGEPVGLIFDTVGNLYGTASIAGAAGGGTVFELTPSGGTFIENTLYAFASPNSDPASGLTFDSSGNLYGSTLFSASGQTSGTIFEMTPSEGGWNYTTLYTLPSQYGGPVHAPLVIDGEGDLLGTSADFAGSGQGGVFKLTNGSGGWTFTSLHDFTGGSDGGQPEGNVVLDANGNIYGTASSGGSQAGICSEDQHTGCGVVWEITP